jgi:hypothetical protein
MTCGAVAGAGTSGDGGRARMTRPAAIIVARQAATFRDA